MFWHELALALGGFTVRELMDRMSVSEARNWKRFVMIFGPIGERRRDVHFAYLRHAVISGYAAQPPSIEECKLHYDYRDHFRPADAHTAIEKMVNNIDQDIAVLEQRFGGGKELGVRPQTAAE